MDEKIKIHAEKAFSPERPGGEKAEEKAGPALVRQVPIQEKAMSERPGTAEPDALRKPEPEAQSKVAPGRSSKAATTSPRKIDTASEEKLSWWKRLCPHFRAADFLFCLADAFLGESLLALLLFSGESGLFEKAYLGRSFLPLQLAAFFVLFLIFALLRARFEKAPRESQTILLANLYYLGLAFSGKDFPTSFGLFLLGLLFLWPLRHKLEHDAPRWPKVLSLFSLLCVGLLLILSILQALPHFAAMFDSPELSPGGDALADHYFYLERREAWVFIIAMTVGLMVFALRLMTEYLDSKRKVALQKDQLLPLKLLLAIFLVAAPVVCHFYFSGRLLLAKVSSLSAGAKNFALFRQLFNSMSQNGLPISSLATDGIGSYFSLHLSPLLYAFLPSYLLFPRPETLQLLTIVTVVASVIPLFYLCRHFHLGTLETGILAAFYLLQTGLICSEMQGISEAILYPLFLNLFFLALFEHNLVGLIASSFFLLLIHENSGFFLLCGAIYLLAHTLSEDASRLPGPSLPAARSEATAGKKSQDWSKATAQKEAISRRDTTALSEASARSNEENIETLHKRRQREIIVSATLICVALTHLLACNLYLARFGNGLFAERGPLLAQNGQLSFLSILGDVFQNPAYVLHLIFEPRKLRYLVISLASMGFLPFFLRRKRDMILFLPLLLNLLSENIAEFSFGTPYSYGSQTFLFLAALLAYLELKRPEHTRFLRSGGSALLAGGLCTSMLFSLGLLRKEEPYLIRAEENKAQSLELRQNLSKIPRDRRIAAGQYLCYDLADVMELYDIDHNPSIRFGRDIDLLLIDTRHADLWSQSVAAWYKDKGFVYSEDLSGKSLAAFVLDKRSRLTEGESTEGDAVESQSTETKSARRDATESDTTKNDASESKASGSD